MSSMKDWRKRKWPRVRPRDFTPEQRREYEQERNRRRYEDEEYRASLIARSLLRQQGQPDEHAESTMRYKYGPLAIAHRDVQLLAQDGLCAICEKPFTSRRVMRQDHDHACCPPYYKKGGTHRFCGKCNRGIICARCNLKLHAIEDTEWRAKAERYVMKWRRTENCT